MISVAVYINNQPIILCTAVNVSVPGLSNHRVHTYRLDDGTILKHRRDRGAAKLAIEMLKTVKEGV